jgi:2-polyprenyl-6-hydroxyphenyl methylase / 3-demethylubiquinone-9 3-methyltransferase
MARPATPINNSFYDQLGERWVTAQDDPIALLRAEGRVKQQWIAEQLQLLTPAKNPLRFVDLGCGAGFLTHNLGALGHSVIGLDLSFSSLSIARKHAQGKANYLQGSGYLLPFGDRTCDAVSALDLLEHVEDPGLIISEAARVLRPGGLFFFHTFSRNLLSWLFAVKGLEWFVRNTPANMHVYRLFIQPGELAAHCRNHGLTPLAWTGIKPVLASFAFWRLLATGSVSPDFRFCLTRTLALSYMGVAKKV